MRAPESIHFAAVDATPAAFTLYGGVYVLAVQATFGGGNVGVEIALPDGTTYVDAHTALTAAGISTPLYLPPGKYRIAIDTATAVTATLTRVPFE